MSKAHDPHWRYIALKLEGGPATRRSMQNAILGRARKEGIADDLAPQLTRFDWPHAIVKVHHHQVELARDWLPRVAFVVDNGERLPLKVETMKSSGTIKSLTGRLGILPDRGSNDAAKRTKSDAPK